jgi:hypothetical protein
MISAAEPLEPFDAMNRTETSDAMNAVHQGRALHKSETKYIRDDDERLRPHGCHPYAPFIIAP